MKLFHERHSRPWSLATELQEAGIGFGQRLDVLEVVAVLAITDGLVRSNGEDCFEFLQGRRVNSVLLRL